MDSTTESAMIFVNGFPRYSEVVFMRVNASLVDYFARLSLKTMQDH